ncbi:MAG: translocation/assembly module TamB domain-containing protein [Henriciella sp.]
MVWASLFDRPWKRIAIGVAAAVVFILIFLRIFLMTPMAHAIVESRLEALTVRGQSVEVEHLRGDLFSGAKAEHIRVRDETGMWMELDQVEVSWSLIPLAFGELDLRNVGAESVRVERRPVLAPATGSSANSPFDRYRIGQLELLTLSLADGVAGPAQAYHLSGELDAQKWTGALKLNLTPIMVSGDKIEADIAWGGDTMLEGDFDLLAAPDGLISKLLGAPEGEPLSATLTASGGLLGGDLEADARLGGETVLSLTANARRQSYTVSGRADLSRFSRFSAMANRLGGAAEFSAELDPERRLSARMSAPNGAIEIEGDVQDAESGRMLENLVLRARGLDMPGLSGLSRLEMVDFDASGRVSQVDGKITFDGRIEAPSLKYGDYHMQTVSSDGQISFGSGVLSVDSLLTGTPLKGVPSRIRSAPVRADFVGHYALDRGLLSVEQMNVRGAGISAGAIGTFRPGGAVDFSGTFGVESVSILEQVTGVFELSGDDLSTVEFSLEGRAQAKPSAPQIVQALAPQLEYSVSAKRVEDGLSIARAEITADTISATLRGDLDPDRVALMGEVEALLDDAVTGFDGPVRSQISLSGTPTRPAIILNLDGTFQGDPVVAGMTAQFDNGRLLVSGVDAEWRQLIARGQGQFDFSAIEESVFETEIEGAIPNVSDLQVDVDYGGRELIAQIAMRDVQTDQVTLGAIDLDLSGNWPEFSGTATYDGEVGVLDAPMSISGAHPLVLNAENRELSLAGDAKIGDQTLAISAPLSFAFTPNLMVRGALSGFGGEIALDFDNSGARPSTLAVSEIALEDIGVFLQRPGLLGTASGRAELQIGDLGLDGAASLSITGLSRAGAEYERAALTMESRVLDGRIDVSFDVDSAKSDMTLTGAIKTDLIHSGSLLSIRAAPNAPMPISLVGEGELAPLWALAAPLDLRFGGKFALAVSNGDGQSFRFSGPASVTNGVFEDGITGIFLEDLNAELQLDPSAIKVEQASARGAKGGSITASGTYNFNGDSNLEISLNRLRALRRNDVSTTLTGQAKVDRRNRRTHVQGDVRIDEMRVDLTKLPQAGYTVLDVQFDNNQDLDAETETETETGPGREAISLDLKVEADRRVFINGLSFESEWGVDARVRGSPGDPRLSGSASLVRGETNLLGQRFALSEGIVRFVGPLQDSELALQADRTRDGITTIIALTGPLSDPDIELSSDPNLPEDEVLARVLFGRSPSNLSPLQAAQLAGAAAQLAGGDAFSLTGELQDATGLDRLDFGFDDEGQATLSTGKYLADDVYLEIESGATGAPAVALEWTPLSNVEVDAEVDPELGPKVAIQWKRDFDRLPGEPRQE